MKNRLLPLGFLAFFLGTALMLMPQRTLAAFPDNPGKGGIDRMQQIRSNQITGTIDVADVMKANLQFSKMNLKSTSGLGLDWQQIGPNNFSGRSRSVLFDNRDANGQTLFTGAVTGGVWKSDNYGLTWTQVDIETSEVLRVSALTQTPGGTIFVGTGEWSCGSGQFMGTGLFRSEDGISFTQVENAKPTANNSDSDWAYVIKLTSDKNGRIFAGTNKGIRYSDNGNTWTSLIEGAVSDVVTGSDGTVAIAINQKVYIAAGGNLSQLTDVSTGEAGKLPFENVGTIELAIAPSDPNIIYASLAKAADNYLLNLFVSTDKGNTWSVIFPSNPSFEPLGDRGCDANTLAVFPGDPTKLLFGGTDCWYGVKVQETGFYNWEQVSFGFASPLFSGYAPSYHHDYVFRPNSSTEFVMATDNGVTTGVQGMDEFTFQSTNKNLVTTQFNSIAPTLKRNYAIGGAESNGVLVFGALPANNPTDGTQILLGDGSYCEWSIINPNVIIYGSQGNTVPYVRSEDLGTTTSPTFLGNIGSTLTDYLPIKLWESFDYENTRDSVNFIARDSTLPAGTTVLAESKNFKFQFPYVLPVTLQKGDSIHIPDVVQSRFFIYGTRSKSGIFMTKQALQFSVDPEWYCIAQTDPVTCMTVSPDLNYLWAGTATGKLYRVSNIALAYDSATADVNSPGCIIATEMFQLPQFADRYISSVAIHPENDQKVIVTLGNYGNGNYVFMSENALDSLPSFTSIQGNLPVMPVYSSLFEMNSSSRVIIGTDFGIFSTDNASGTGTQWADDMAGIGNVPVVMLEQQITNHYLIENYGAIYAASYGHGLFKDETYYTPLGIDPVAGSKTNFEVITASPNPFKDQVDVRFTLNRSQIVIIDVVDLTGKTIASYNVGNLKAGEHTATLTLATLTSGAYILKMNGATAKVVKIQ